MNDTIIKLVEEYSDMIIRISFSYMKNMSDAEDITQEVFLKVMKNHPYFENSIHEKAWLIRKAINICKNRLKTAWFRKAVPLDDGICSFTPEENTVLDAVMKLPTKYRSITLLLE